MKPTSISRTACAAALICGALALAGCATSNPDIVQRGDAQRMSQVQDATVLSARAVTIDGTQSGIGGAAGGVIGGISGSSVGGRREAAAVGVLVAIVGAVVGNAIERNATREDAVEYLLQLRNGERRALVQGKGEEVLNAGDPVILVTTAGKTRILRAPALATPGQPASKG